MKIGAKQKRKSKVAFAERALPARVMIAAKNAAFVCAQIQAEGMRAAAPVRSGKLRGQIKVRPLKYGARAYVRGRYPLGVEFGTDDTPAHPFIRPIFRRNLDTYKKLFIAAGRAALLEGVA